MPVIMLRPPNIYLFFKHTNMCFLSFQMAFSHLHRRLEVETRDNATLFHIICQELKPIWEKQKQKL